MFPTLTPKQMKRITARGKTRSVRAGEILVEAGQEILSCFVVIAGHLEIVRSYALGETLVTVLGPGQFTGEVSILSGRPSLVRIRALEAGEAVELDREHLLALVQVDAELSELVMRAFIVRRVQLIASGLGDVVLIGSNYCSATLGVKEFLNRNGHPYSYVDLDRDPDVQQLLDRFHVTAHDVPVLICRNEAVLRNPTNRQIAECLGLNEAVDALRMRDVIVVGAGPAGLAAAVYAASEGLDVLVLETNAPGGQAGSSSKIENYLGFPTGISGQALAGRAFTQAQKFGAHVMVASGAVRLICDRSPYVIEVDGGERLRARTVVIATGAQYRKPPIENLPLFENAGVYYGATFMEAQLCHSEEIVVVGGGNSAGQAAVFLSQTARHVHMLVRSSGLSETMSRYLVRRIEDNPSITLHAHTEIVALEGDEHLEKIQWRNTMDGHVDSHAIRHVFMMTGAVPATAWIDGCITLDTNGFVKTGPDLSPEDMAAQHWPLTRAPYLLETSRPGILAVGDARSGNIKRVASAVGEGSIAIAFVHRILHE